jgi:hypothetical protein
MFVDNWKRHNSLRFYSKMQIPHVNLDIQESSMVIIYSLTDKLEQSPLQNMILIKNKAVPYTS